MNTKEFLPLPPGVKPYEDVVRTPFKVEWMWKDTHPRANKDICLKSLARDMFERACSYEDFEKECERLRSLQEHDRWAPKNEAVQPTTLRAVEKWLGIVSPSETP